MKSTKKIVSVSLLANIVVWLSLIAVTHFMVFKPLFEDLDSWAKKSIEVGDLYKPASEGNPQELARLEQITHENNGFAYLILIAIEREKAIKASGVDFKTPGANVESIDVSKTQALLLQAMRELSDIELHGVLENESAVFDTDTQERMFRLSNEKSVWRQNAIRFFAHSTFDQATKDILTSCHKKLEKTYHSTLLAVLNIRSRGACSGIETQTTYSNIFEKTKAQTWSGNTDKLEAQMNAWWGEPSAN